MVKPSGDYNDMAELAHFVVEAYERGDASCFPAIFQLAEEFLLTGHPKQKEIITFGLLEDIQTISSHHDFGPDVFVPYLGPQSRARMGADRAHMGRQAQSYGRRQSRSKG